MAKRFFNPILIINVNKTFSPVNFFWTFIILQQGEITYT